MAQHDQEWQRLLENDDENAFREIVEPVIPTMTRVARRELAFYLRQRRIHPQDTSPESVVGEALLQAWQHRKQRPERMSLRGWLLGVQHRVLRGLVEKQQQYREDKAISLDKPLPLETAAEDSQEWFWDWYQPDGEITWEDVTPGSTLEEVELSIENDIDGVFEDEEQERVLMMHDEFRMPLPEVAFTMNRSVQEIADLVDRARATLRERGVSDSEIRETDEPAPPSAADR